MKPLLISVLFALIPGTLHAQEPTRNWSPGEPGPLPVRVMFFSSNSDNILDSLSVHEAVAAGMQGAGLPLDLEVFKLGHPTSDRRFLFLEVDVYSGAEVRYERTVMEPDGMPIKGCNGVAHWSISGSTPAKEHLAERVRLTVECIRRAFNVEW